MYSSGAQNVTKIKGVCVRVCVACVCMCVCVCMCAHVHVYVWACACVCDMHLLDVFRLQVVVDAIDNPAKHPAIQCLRQSISTVAGLHHSAMSDDLLPFLGRSRGGRGWKDNANVSASVCNVGLYFFLSSCNKYYNPCFAVHSLFSNTYYNL